MKMQRISDGWLTSAPGKDGLVPVDLPDDYAITQPRDPDAPGGGQNGYFAGGRARYLKYMTIESAPDTHTILDADGAYMISTVKVNDHFLYTHTHGYTPFLVDLTDKLLPGETNKLEIDTDAPQPSTRWYSGAGIYRDVFLWTGGFVRVEPHDLWVTTERADEAEAVIRIRCTVTADRDTAALVTFTLPGVGRTSRSFVARAGKNGVERVMTVPAPRLWHPDHPALYTLEAEVSVNGRVTDTASVRFGIRTVTADAEKGLCVNGQPLKLRGGCIHHDHGVLGAAAYPAAERRKAARLKAVGFNALRIAHNPPSRALLDACDELGLIVMDEAFDMWDLPKNEFDYHLWFRDRHEQDIARMVCRDRAHPSVIAYSIGNEITESAGTADCDRTGAMLASEIRKYDDTRFVTIACWGVQLRPEDADPEDYKKAFMARHTRMDARGWDVSWPDRTEALLSHMDIAGYNYQYETYESDHDRFPDRVIWGSETHVLHFWDSWHKTARLPYVIGDFTWTAYDNLGEAGAGRALWARDGFIPYISIAEYPWRTCRQGDLDLCGYRRPQSYFREAVWLSCGSMDRPASLPPILTTHPEHNGEGFSGTGWHWYDVHETWTFGEDYIGRPVSCEIYTDADEVSWTLNGTPVGTSRPEKGIARMTVAYAPGTLEAELKKDGAVLGTSALVTTGGAARVTVAPEAPTVAADGRDLAYFEITVTDAGGRRVTESRAELTASVTGGTLMGIFSADPKNEDVYTSPVCHAFDGRALAVVKTGTPGRVTLTVSSDGLAAGEAFVDAE